MDDKNGGNLPQKSKLPAIALGFDLGAVVVFLFGFALAYLIYILLPVGLLFMLIALFMPVGGIISGICALCLGKDKIGKSGTVISVIAIVLPIVAFVVTVILFSTGVAYIRFM